MPNKVEPKDEKKGSLSPRAAKIEKQYLSQLMTANKPRIRQLIVGYNNNQVSDDEMDLSQIQNLVEKQRHYDKKVKEYQDSRAFSTSEIAL